MSIKDPARLVSELEYEYGMKPGTLASKQVSKSVSNVRRIAIRKLRKQPFSLSFPEIGTILRRDHTSILRLISPAKKK